MKTKKDAIIVWGDWPLPAAYLAELGRVVILWSALERQLDLILGKLMGFNDMVDMRPFIAFNHASFPQKLDALGALCELLSAEHRHLSGCAKVVEQIRTAQTLRNRFMHNGMTYDLESGVCQMGVGTARGKLKTRVDQVSLADIQKATIAISEAQSALHELVLKTKREPGWKTARTEHPPA